MRLAIHFPNFTIPGGTGAIAGTLSGAAKAADEGGCAQFTVMDHWFQMEMLGGAAEPMLEGYTTLGYLAAQTERVTLGLLVTGVTYRHPGLLAKTVATLDVLSGGRAQLGIGAAWYEEEHVGLGVPFPPVSERFERLEEAIEICKQMWSDDDGSYDGRHYQLAQTVCLPKPLQEPSPRVLIGGSGERKTLRLVARHADACNLFGTSLEEIKHKLEVLDRHCEVEGRDPATIERTMLAPGLSPLEDVDGFLREMSDYQALGIGQVWVSPSAEDPVGSVRAITEALVGPMAEL